jgi:hypothetical protein
VFLDAIKAHFASAPSSSSLRGQGERILDRIFPSVSIEPKFHDRKYLLKLIEEAHKNILVPIRAPSHFLRVAVVVHNTAALHLVSRHLKLLQTAAAATITTTGADTALPLLTVALAYRSQLIAPSDYVWTARSGDRVARQIAQFHHQHHQQEQQQEQQQEHDMYVKKLHMPDVVQLLAHAPPPPLPPALLSSSYSSSLSLSLEQGQGQEEQQRARRERWKGEVIIKKREQPEVVAWVVDEPKQLCAALAGGADAVISNNPLLLLAYLQETHRKKCHYELPLPLPLVS